VDSDFVHAPGLEGEGFFGSCEGRLGGGGDYSRWWRGVARWGAGEEKNSWWRPGAPVDCFEHIVAFYGFGQTFHAIVLEYIRLADRPQILVDARSQRDHGGVYIPCPESFDRLKDQGGEVPWVRMSAEIAVGLRVR
jgi:hypothetical protein